MLAIVCPGQGSQTPGFLSPWLELPGSAERLDALSEASGTDLRKHGTTSDAPTIRDTAVAQPLIVSASLLAYRALQDALDTAGISSDGLVDITAGHSVGELAAAAVAGVLDDTGAATLVAARARAMAGAAALEPSGMAAVVGGDPDEVLAAIERAGLHPANVNGGGQVVAAGSPAGLARLAADPPARSRVIPLEVAGAFHTPYMQHAAAQFEPVATGWAAADPQVLLLSNADGAPYRTPDAPLGRGRDVMIRLAAQVVAPVRWDLCQATFADLGVTGLVELAPAGVLTGLARRSLPGVQTVAVKTPDDLAAARELVLAHTGARTGTLSTDPRGTEETTA